MWQRAIIVNELNKPWLIGKKIWTKGKPFLFSGVDIESRISYNESLVMEVNIYPKLLDFVAVRLSTIELLNEFSEVDPPYLTWEEFKGVIK